MSGSRPYRRSAHHGGRCLDWHPAVASVRLTGTGIGQFRRIETRDGREIVERLVEINNLRRFYRYTLVAGVPASHYTGVIEVTPKASGCVAEWRVQYLANNQPDIVVRNMVSTLVRTGLGSLKPRFGNAA